MRLIDAGAVRNALYAEDAITMKGVAIINQFPTIEAKPVVHGKWLIHKGHFHDFAECSLCGEDYGKDTAMAFNYCPYCGAKMDGDGSE